MRIITLCLAIMFLASCQTYQGHIYLPADTTVTIGEIKGDPGAAAVVKSILKRKLQSKGFVFADNPGVEISGDVSYSNWFIPPCITNATIQVDGHGLIISEPGFLSSHTPRQFAGEISKRILRKK